jgi:O-antigen ligase
MRSTPVRDARPAPRVRARAPSHRLLTLTVLALPFSYVPLELLPTKVSITIGVFALVLATGIRYRVLGARPRALEVVTLVLSAFILVRLTAIAALQSAPVDWLEAVSAALAPIGGVILFRIAQRAEARPALLRALQWMLLLLAAVAVYQSVVGLAWLQSRGYAEGFYYFTFEGTYRAFGTFLSPTVFGAFVATVGAAIVCMVPRVRDALAWLAVALVPLLLTQTRAAWIAFGVAVLLGWLLRSRANPVHLTLAVAAIGWGSAFVVWLVPSAVDGVVARLATITDAGFSSNMARSSLWRGTLDATLDRAPLVGLPADEFVAAVGAIAGEYADFGHAHSNYLQILFLYGLIGLALFLTILVVSGAGVLRAVATATHVPWAYGSLAALAAFAIDSAFETSWTSFSVVATLYLLLGLGWAAPAGAAGAAARAAPAGAEGAAAP